MRALIALLLITLFGGLGLWWAGYHEAAWWMGNLGPFLALGVMTIYVVGFDSRKRWPGTAWIVRFGRVFSFQR